MLVDDIHWAEPALLDLLAGLPATVDDAPLLVLCLARPELLESRPELAGDGAARTARRRRRRRAAREPAGRPRRCASGSRRPRPATRSSPRSSCALGAREGGDAATTLPTSLNALLGARLDRLEARRATRSSAARSRARSSTAAAIVELSDEESRPSVPGELGQLARKDLIRPAAASLRGRGRATGSSTSSSARPPTGRPRRSCARRCTSGSPTGSNGVAGERVGEYQEILGYHFEQAYRYRAELGPVDDDARALAARAARHLGAAGRRANDRGDVYAAANLLGRAAALLRRTASSGSS